MAIEIAVRDLIGLQTADRLGRMEALAAIS